MSTNNKSKMDNNAAKRQAAKQRTMVKKAKKVARKTAMQKKIVAKKIEQVERVAEVEEQIVEQQPTEKIEVKIEAKKPKKPPIFEVAVTMSDNLCDFLGKPHNSKMSRNDVTHNIRKYCASVGIMVKRTIIPDDKMKTIMISVPDELTWLNLQTYIKHNYI